MGDIYVESSEKNTKVNHVDANKVYDCNMRQYLPYKDNRFTNDVRLIEGWYCAETGYFVEVDLQYPTEIKE